MGFTMVRAKEDPRLGFDGGVEFLQGLMEIIREYVMRATAPILYAASKFQEYLRHFSRQANAWIFENSSN